MSIPVRYLSYVLVVSLFALLTACGPSNNVRLIYKPGPNAVLPQPEAPRVTVVMFEDERPSQTIGQRNDGSAFTASSLVSDWISRSMGDELGRLGPQVSYATTQSQARSAQPDYIVSGIVRELWIKENSPTSFTATLRMTVTLANRKGVIYSENLSSTQERQGLPSAAAVENLLSDTLRDVLVPAAKKIESQLH